MVSLNKWTTKTLNFTPTGQESWTFSSIKESLKYFPVFKAAGNVEHCLLVPLDDKSSERIKAGNDLVLKKVGDSAWITPPNVNGIVSLWI